MIMEKRILALSLFIYSFLGVFAQKAVDNETESTNADSEEVEALNDSNTTVINDYSVQLENALKKNAGLLQRKAELVDSIDKLKDKATDLNRLLKSLRTEIGNVYDKVESLQSKQRSTGYNGLVFQQESLEKSIKHKNREVNRLKNELAKYYEQVKALNTQKNELEGVKNKISADLLSKFSPELEYSLSKINIDKLNDIVAECSAYTADQKINAFVAKVERVRKNKECYDLVQNVLNSQYDSISVVKAQENIKKMDGLNEVQNKEKNELRKKLGCFAEGLKALKEYINNFNRLRGENTLMEYAFFYKDDETKIFKDGLKQKIDNYVYSVPYLKDKYESFHNYLEALNKTEEEKEIKQLEEKINSIVVEITEQ